VTHGTLTGLPETLIEKRTASQALPVSEMRTRSDD
jgi:hypothetical protein